MLVLFIIGSFLFFFLLFRHFSEDNAIVIAPLIPWSIAGAVPLASVGAPTALPVSFICFLCGGY